MEILPKPLPIRHPSSSDKDQLPVPAASLSRCSLQ
jgi:hypothetical protein